MNNIEQEEDVTKKRAQRIGSIATAMPTEMETVLINQIWCQESPEEGEFTSLRTQGLLTSGLSRYTKCLHMGGRTTKGMASNLIAMASNLLAGEHDKLPVHLTPGRADDVFPLHRLKGRWNPGRAKTTCWCALQLTRWSSESSVFEGIWGWIVTHL